MLKYRVALMAKITETPAVDHRFNLSQRSYFILYFGLKFKPQVYHRNYFTNSKILLCKHTLKSDFCIVKQHRISKTNRFPISTISTQISNKVQFNVRWHFMYSVFNSLCTFLLQWSQDKSKHNRMFIYYTCYTGLFI